jgi:phosphoenolpyruvate synthase/pyruvate phosphate dikinase
MSEKSESSRLTPAIHQDHIRHVPRFGGVLVWGSVTIVALLLAVVSFFADAELFQKLSFLSRNQTWVPLATLILGGLVGAIDDYLVCRDQGTFVGGGLSVKARLLHVFVVALLAGWWFYVKLGVSTIAIPFSSPLVLGPVIIALFVVVMIGLYTGGIIDGHEIVSGARPEQVRKALLGSRDFGDVQDFRGMTASLGKAQGVVRILRSAKEVDKVKPGDVLVAVMTRPDYVPAMKRAAAIVTDEGGITSHAAIVSRELRIPCVIGTKIATQVLRDGDVVEVSANHGLVRVLQRQQG